MKPVQKSFIGIIMAAILLLMNGCSLKKILQEYRNGYLENEDYYTEIPFQYINKLIIIEVSIEGKPYNFILDTGASTCVVDLSVSKNMSYKSIANYKVSDSGGKTKDLEYISIPEILISDLSYRNNVTVKTDFSIISNFFGCEIEIKGIIGNQMMRNGIWIIDYERETITITDDTTYIKPTEKTEIVSFSSNDVGNAYIEIQLNGVVKKFTFDTGSVGKVRTDNEVFELVKTRNDSLQINEEEGLISIGLHGPNYGMSSYAYIDSVQIGGIQLENQIVKFKESGSSLLGNQFYEHFKLTIDWGNQQLFLDPVEPIDADTLNAFEYTITTSFPDSCLKITSKWLNRVSDTSLQLGSCIRKMNDFELYNLSREDFCEFVNNQYQDLKEQDELKLELDDAGKKRELILTKTQIFPKQ